LIPHLITGTKVSSSRILPFGGLLYPARAKKQTRYPAFGPRARAAAHLGRGSGEGPRGIKGCGCVERTQPEEEHSELLGSGPVPGSDALKDQTLALLVLAPLYASALLNPEFISSNLVMERLLCPCKT
jgi:hypothetical protein